MDGFRSLPQFAAGSGQHPDAVRRDAMAGKLTAAQDGAGRWWISERDYEQAVAERAAETDARATAQTLPGDDLRRIAVALRMQAFHRARLTEELRGLHRDAEAASDWPRVLAALELLAEVAPSRAIPLTGV